MEVIKTTDHDAEIERIEREKDELYKEQVRKRFKKPSIIRSARLASKKCKRLAWVPNGFSYLLAIYSVYYFSSLYTGFKFYLIVVIGVLGLAAWELGKRACLISFYEGFFGVRGNSAMLYGVVVVALIGGSMATTYYGGDKFVENESKEQEVVHNPKIDSLQAKIKTANANKDEMRKQTWRGKIVGDARENINIQDNLIADWEKQIAFLEARDIDTNDQLGEDHKDRLANFGLIFGGFGAIMDIILIVLIGYAEKKEAEVHFLNLSDTDKKPSNKRSESVPNRSKRSEPKEESRQEVPAIATAEAKRPIGFKTSTDASVKPQKGIRTCLNCNTDISHKRSDAKYCSTPCRKAFWETSNINKV